MVLMDGCLLLSTFSFWTILDVTFSADTVYCGYFTVDRLLHSQDRFSGMILFVLRLLNVYMGHTRIRLHVNNFYTNTYQCDDYVCI